VSKIGKVNNVVIFINKVWHRVKTEGWNVTKKYPSSSQLLMRYLLTEALSLSSEKTNMNLVYG